MRKTFFRSGFCGTGSAGTGAATVAVPAEPGRRRRCGIVEDDAQRDGRTRRAYHHSHHGQRERHVQGRGNGSRFGVAGTISAALHVALALAVMVMVVRAPRATIPLRVVFDDPAPPPPAGSAGTATVAAPVPAEPVPQKPERKKVFRHRQAPRTAAAASRADNTGGR